MKLISKLLLIILYLGFFLLIGPISIWLLFNACTWVGYGFSFLGISILVLPILILIYNRKINRQRHLKWGIISLCVVWLGIVGAILWQPPTGDPGANSPIRHGFTGEEKFSRYNLTNIVPEIEQINLGFFVMRYLDPLLTAAQAREVALLTQEIYQEMESDQNFHELGSVLGWSYIELLGSPFDQGHYYLYIPQDRPEEPLPALIFLHGSAGNFKAYTWILARLAEEQGMVIISPSYGFGNWDHNSTRIVRQVLEDVRVEIEFDSDQIYLAGLSNGGLGVSRVGQEMPEIFKGLIFISPVMDNHIVDSSSFQDQWKDRPILVISGAEDRRVPLTYVQQRVSNLEAAGIQVTSQYYAGEDHFLFFAQKDSILNTIVDWIRKINS